MLKSCHFHRVADLADPVESVSPPVAFHPMPKHSDSRKVFAGQCVTKDQKVFFCD